MSLFDRIFGKKEEEKKPIEQRPERREPQRRGFNVGDKIWGIWTVRAIKGGGMGIVYIAQDEGGLLYAIKTLQDRFFEDEIMIKKFIDEANTWMDLGKHSNIVFANGVFRIPEGYLKPYLLLEYIGGGDLHNFIGLMDIPQTLDFAIQFCDGMSYAFNKLGMVHRDIKPANVMIAKDERFRFGYVVKVTDFGLAKVYEKELIEMEERKIPEGYSIKQSSIGGTLPYMSPEQFTKVEIDTKSDIYSFGCMLYEMLTRRLPLYASTPKEFMHKHLNKIPINPREINPKIPEELDALVMKCIQKEPEGRYQNFEEVINELIRIYKKGCNEDYLRIGKEEKLTAVDRFHRGVSYAELKRLSDAEREYREAIRINPNYAEAHFNLGSLLDDYLKREEEAEKEYREAIRINPNHALAHFNLSFLLLELKRVEEAEEEHREATRLKPDYADISAFSLANVKRKEDAEAEYREAIKFNPNDAEAHNNLGNLMIELKRVEEAEKEYREAIRINPSFVAAHNNLGNLLKDFKRMEEAEKEYNEAIRINPSFAEAHYNLGLLLANLKRVKEAEKEWREAIRLNPNYVEAHGNLGFLLANLKRIEEAEKEYREVLRINPYDAKAHDYLGVLLVNSKRVEEAEKEWREAIRINPNFTEAHNNLGSLYANLGKFDEALKCFNKALEINPNFEGAKRNRELCLRLMNRL